MFSHFHKHGETGQNFEIINFSGDEAWIILKKIQRIKVSGI